MTPLERAMRRAKIAAYDEIAVEVGHRNSHPIEVIEAVRRRGGQGETILKLKQDIYLLKARIKEATCAPIGSDADSAEDRDGSRPEKEK